MTEVATLPTETHDFKPSSLEQFLEDQGFKIIRPFRSGEPDETNDRCTVFQSPMHYEDKAIEALLINFYEGILDYTHKGSLTFKMPGDRTLVIKLNPNHYGANRPMEMYSLTEKLIE